MITVFLVILAILVVVVIGLDQWIGRATDEHHHVWRVDGYGGAGWYQIRCDCGATEITDAATARAIGAGETS